MSNYYKYDFVSAEPLFANVREELRSYFDTGIVDDLMFPIWVDKCLKKLGKSSYKIVETYLEIDAYQAKLPPDFVAVREAWSCTTVYKQTPIPGAFYRQTTMKITDNPDLCSKDYCDECEKCKPDIMHVVYKTTNEVLTSFQVTHLLRPGNISAKQSCSLDCKNLSSTSIDTFDIRDNKFITNFPSGNVYMVYYSSETDENGVNLVPDNYRIKEYIEHYIKYKIFEQLYNTVTDETFNQIERKYMHYKQMYEESYVIADIEIKKETAYDKLRKVKQSYNRLNPYKLD